MDDILSIAEMAIYLEAIIFTMQQDEAKYELMLDAANQLKAELDSMLNGDSAF